MYDQHYLQTTLKILLTDLKDFENWSVHNQDKYNAEILDLKDKIEKIQVEEDWEEYENKQKLLHKFE